MKPYKFLFTILFAIIPFIVGATGQITEKIYINGVRCDLLSLPIECDDLLSVKVGELVPDGYVNTGLYRGYIGEWELKENKLYLRKIILGYTEKTVPTDVLNRVFAPYCTNEGILASWLTGFLRVGKGEMLVYDDFWEACTYEHEMFLTIKDGCVTGEKVYDIVLSELREELPDMKIMIMEPFVLEGTASVSIPERPDRYDIFKKGVDKAAKTARKMAEKYDCKFIEIQKHLDEVAKVKGSSYLSADGVHPSDAGHELIKNEWLKAFNEIK